MNANIGRTLSIRKCTVARGLFRALRVQPRRYDFRCTRSVRNLAFTASLATSGTASCLAERSSSRNYVKTSELVLPAGSNLEAPCKATWRLLLQRLRRTLKLLMRALALMSVWLPVAASGLTVDLLERLPVFPDKVAAHLRGMWWTVLLKAIDLCGPTFIKVGTGYRLVVFQRSHRLCMGYVRYSRKIDNQKGAAAPGVHVRYGRPRS